MPAERLQKVLAAAGVASRRGAEALIANGRVTVDGRPAKPGSQADPDTQIIAVDGRVIGAAAGHAHLLLHKPIGVTSTTRDRHAERTVLDLVPTALVPDGVRLYPVGRLDLDSEGMLLLTNDGPWADRILHPRHGVEREYAIGLERELDADQIDLLRAGIQLEEGLASLINLRQMTNIEVARLIELLRPAPPELAWYRATLTQGWKRQLRRMFGAVGAPVQRLVRVRIGPVRIDGLRSGSIRALKAPEIRNLGAGGGRSRAAVAADAADAADGATTEAAGGLAGASQRPPGPRRTGTKPSPKRPPAKADPST
jgi:23S rRNA pseudouridine2605 synthase